MANNFDASIKLLYPVDQGSFFTIDVLEPTDSFDVIANVEIGQGLNQFVSEHVLRVSVVNLMTGGVAGTAEVRAPLTPQLNTQRREEIRANLPVAKDVSPGDVLQAVASYKVIAGANVDISTEKSETFAVGG